MAETHLGILPLSWRSAVGRLREHLSPSAYQRAPDYGPETPTSGRQQWLCQLARTRNLLEQAREVVAGGGWTGSGSWFTVRQRDGTVRDASLAESFDLREPGTPVAGACVVGILIRLAGNPDRVPTVDDVWHATDELHEAMHEWMGHDAFPPGRSYSMSQRRGRLRDLTAWNDAPGRTREEVLEVFDRAISRTIVGSVA